jgi:hypothetical protein
VKLYALALVTLVMLGIAELVVRPFTPREIVGPSAVRFDPLYGRVLIPGYRGTVTIPGTSYKFSVNSMGFRGPEPAGPLDGAILFLGDSYTLGDGVDDGKEFAQLVARSTGITGPVINAGLAGEGQGRWLKILDHQAPGWKPRCVVLQFCNNDFRDNFEDRIFTLTPEGALMEHPVPAPSPLRRVQAVVERLPLIGYSRLYALAKRAIASATEKAPLSGRPSAPGQPNPAGIPWDDDTDTSAFDDLTLALTRASIERCQRNGWPVIGITAQLGPGQRLDRLRAEFDRVGAPFIVIPTKAQRPDLHHTEDDHWNESGHAFAADQLTPEIARALASPPPSEPAR